nr:MAG TPA: hypothetical protein [Caudoviricetes sp.]
MGQRVNLMSVSQRLSTQISRMKISTGCCLIYILVMQ